MTDALAIGSDDALAMTHQPEGPNPVTPVVNAAKEYIRPKMLDPAPPLWSARSLDELMSHPAVQTGLDLGVGRPGMPHTMSPAAIAATQRGGMGMRAKSIWGDPKNVDRLREGIQTEGRTATEMAAELGVSRPALISKWNHVRQQEGIPPSRPARGQRGAAVIGHTPGMPAPNLPPAEDIDPAELQQFLKLFSFKEK
jgi:hypothetical protein